MQSLSFDRPLQGQPYPFNKLHPQLYSAEFVGTALLVFFGLSAVIALWGPGSSLSTLPLSIGARRLLNGFLFGSVGAAIALSPLGKISGAHINPAVTLAFWLEGKIKWRDALGYGMAQLSGGMIGAMALMVWGPIGLGDAYGASTPEIGYTLVVPLAGETLCGFLLVLLIFIMATHRRTKRYTPLINPPLFALLSWLEAPLSGASANPARSLGPALVSALNHHPVWHGQWIYVLGPCVGAALAVTAVRLEPTGRHRPAEARQAHFSNKS